MLGPFAWGKSSMHTAEKCNKVNLYVYMPSIVNVNRLSECLFQLDFITLVRSDHWHSILTTVPQDVPSCLLNGLQDNNNICINKFVLSRFYLSYERSLLVLTCANLLQSLLLVCVSISTDGSSPSRHSHGYHPFRTCTSLNKDYLWLFYYVYTFTIFSKNLH